MDCPICNTNMVPLFDDNNLHVMKCTDHGCRFIGLDLDTWQSPYSDADYYTQIQQNAVKPDRPFIRSRVKTVAKYCPRSGRVADLGCGLGETAIALSQTGFDVWGVEESANAIAFLKKSYPEIHWVHGNIESSLKELPLSQNSEEHRFHVITMFHVLEHIPRPRRLIPMLKKNLMPEGYLVVEVPDVYGGLARLRGRKWEHWLSHHVNYFSMDSLRKLLEGFGFHAVYAKKLYHFGHPQGVFWKDVTKNALACMGLNTIIRTIWQLH